MDRERNQEEGEEVPSTTSTSKFVDPWHFFADGLWYGWRMISLNGKLTCTGKYFFDDVASACHAALTTRLIFLVAFGGIAMVQTQPMEGVQ